jgi:hypothetical protein
LRRTGLVLVALALLVRVMVPAGFMTAPDGRSGLVICTGDGAMTISIGADGTVSKSPVDGGQERKASDAPCAFSGAVTPLVSPILALASAPVADHRPVRLALPAHQRPGLGLAAPPPPTTGPPVHV